MVDLRNMTDRGAQTAALLRGLILPVAAAAAIFVILCPLPAGAMDVLLAGNITLAAIILLTVIYVGSPLELSVFPSLLLGATLVRLVLNIATTRLILTAGAGGRGVVAAQAAAGEVIWAFSDFVTSGSLAVGVILFAIIIIVQFIVITKGAARISEVTARFVLDAMPGKQMAIDADLSAGVVSRDEAGKRRREIAREADFYGAMDGASKFLRGDAVASVVITMVNILGGLYIGLVQYGWNASQTVDLFTRLTIGDGLVTQIPALIVSVSAALLITRGTVRTNLGEEVLGQMVSRPIVLAITAVFLMALMLTALPKFPLLMLGVGCGGLAWMLSRRRHAERPARPSSAEPGREAEDDVDELLAVDPMQLELGYALIGFVDIERGGDLLDRVAALRREIALELGLRLPPIRVGDNLRLGPRTYEIRIRGGQVADGQVFPGQWLAVGPEAPRKRLGGREAIDAATGRSAAWVADSQREAAEQAGLELHSPCAVLMRHLGQVVRLNAAELLNRQHVVRMLEHLRGQADSLVQEVTDRLGVGKLHRVLQMLLRERVPIRDIEGICEAISERTDQDGAASVQALSEHVRLRLARTLAQQYCDEDGKLWCVRLEPALEEAIGSHQGDHDGEQTPPELAGRLSREASRLLAGLRRQGRRPVVLCAPHVRPAVHRILRTSQPDAAVLATNEVDSAQVHSVAQLGIET